MRARKEIPVRNNCSLVACNVLALVLLLCALALDAGDTPVDAFLGRRTMPGLLCAPGGSDGTLSVPEGGTIDLGWRTEAATVPAVTFSDAPLVAMGQGGGFMIYGDEGESDTWTIRMSWRRDGRVLATIHKTDECPGHMGYVASALCGFSDDVELQGCGDGNTEWGSLPE